MKHKRQRKAHQKTGLYLRGNVYWMSFTYNNQPYRKSTGARDKTIAQKIYDMLQAKITLGRWHPETIEKEEPQEYNFKELAEKYLNWCSGRQKSYEVKRYVINTLLKTYADYMLNDFCNQTIEQLQTDYLSKDYKPASINKITAILKHMFTKAYDWEMITDNTLRKIRKVKSVKGENKRLRYLSLDECQTLINACDPHLKPIVITALNTGMRKGEILNLKWNNVDLRHGFILLDITKNGERREIPINDTLKDVLQGITRRLDISYVFYDNTTGKPFQDVKRSFNTACRRAGIKDFHFHDLRHTFASQLVMAGVDLTTVKELLGHKTLTMTLRYAHLAPSHKVAAMQKLDGFLHKKVCAIAQV
jgi:integrase